MANQVMLGRRRRAAKGEARAFLPPKSRPHEGAGIEQPFRGGDRPGVAGMNDPLLDERYRDALAAIAAPYCHAKQATVTRMKRLSEMTDAELDQQIAWVKEDMLRLGVGPGQRPRPVS